MTVSTAFATYERARVAYEQAAADLRAAVELDTAVRLKGLPIEVVAIIDAVAKEWDVVPGELLGPKRTADLQLPRHALFAIALERTTMPPHALSHVLGRSREVAKQSARICRNICECDERYAFRVARVRAALDAAATSSPS